MAGGAAGSMGNVDEEGHLLVPLSHIRRLSVALLFFGVVPSVAVAAARCPTPAPNWGPSESELQAVLAAHERWVASKGGDGCQAQLQGANLQDARLERAGLAFADLTNANLIGARLRNVSLLGASLIDANLSNADLTEGNLSTAKLIRATLRNAALERTNLRGAELEGADLRAAVIRDADLTGASFYRVLLLYSVFEPSSFEDVRKFEFGRELWALRFSTSPAALFFFRDDFRKRGLHPEARELTYAIRRQQRENSWRQWNETRERLRVDGGVRGLYQLPLLTEAFGEGFDAIFNLAAFEITCGYGLHRGRPLYIILWLIPTFGLIYTAALVRPGKRGGIWRVWFPDRIFKGDGQTEPVRLGFSRGWGVPQRSFGYRTLRVVGLSMYMSILSAFHIGWRDLNVGTWIARMQPREYVLRGTGWVRVVSGLQSLISVYLIALWVLTYLGRPFD